MNKFPLKKKRIDKYSLKLMLYALPFFILVIMFFYVPIAGWSLAFFDYRPGIRFSSMEFVGLKYFNLIIVYLKDVLNSIVNTLVLSGLNLVLMPLPAIFAILLTLVKTKWLKKLIQSTVTLPHFISWVIVFAICSNLFAYEGVFNQLLRNLGFEVAIDTTLLGNKKLSWYFMTALSKWKGLGWSSIIYLAAIAGIDVSLYEAAELDGAGPFGCIRHITIPGILPTFFVLLLLNIGNFLSVGFEQYLVFSNSLTKSKLEVIDMFVYRIGIGTQDYSFATAIGILRSLISITMIFSMNALSKKVRGESII